jgi:hypothetical protein
MTTATKTQGTEFWWVSGPSAVTKLTQIPSAPSPIGGPRPQIPITHLDSVEEEFVGALPQPAKATFEVIYNPADASHQALLALKGTGAVTPMAIGMSDGTVAPTAASSAFVTTAVARTFHYFNAYVEDAQMGLPANNVTKLAVTLQRSGPTTTVLHT